MPAEDQGQGRWLVALASPGPHYLIQRSRSGRLLFYLQKLAFHQTFDRVLHGAFREARGFRHRLITGRNASEFQASGLG